MDARIPRRQFLKTVPAAGALVYATTSRGDTTPRTATPVEPDGAIQPWRAGGGIVGDYAIRPKPYHEVVLRDDFWRPRVLTNADVTIPFEVRKREEGGRPLDRGVLEAAMLSLRTHPSRWLRERVEARVDELAREEAPASNRHFEIAATWYLTTGRRDLLDRAIRSAERLYQDFTANDPPFDGGERDSWNCAQLYRVTGDPKHLYLAQHYLDIRGREDSVGRSRHNQSYRPVVEQSEAVGHAVNCLTLMVSMAEVAILSGASRYLDAAHRMWHDAVSRKTYITGGVGSTGNEGFGEPFSLPNMDAYAETCAGLMYITLNHRLFLTTGDARYVDVLERAMYNNALSGVSASGDHYFYVNRLASAGDGRDLRWQRASLECCPPNMVRFLARMPGYVYAQDADGRVFVNLYVSSEAAFEVDGRRLALSVESEMPWGGRSLITVSAEEEMEAAIRLRIPGWARNRPLPGGLYAYADPRPGRATVSVNGRRVEATPDDMGYVSLERRWRDGDVIEVALPMEVGRVVADEQVRQTRGRVVVERGPIVFCCEWPDTPDGKVLELLLDDARPRARFDPDLFGGVVAIETRARSITDPSSPLRPVRLIPYALWANRGAGEMSVWLSGEPYAVGDTGPAGGVVFYENPRYAEDGWRYLEAAPCDQSTGAKWGCFRTEIPGARGTEVGTGRQNTLDILAACDDPCSAAHLCASAVVNGVRGWFLPSRDELLLLYRNLAARGLRGFESGGAPDNVVYWTSSQISADMAGHVDLPDLGRVHFDDKDFPRRVRAIRAF